jgi:geranylgeranyl diphosphate synthase type 3
MTSFFWPQGVQYSSNKGFAEDLTEGKFSFPVIHGIHANTTNRQVLSTSRNICPLSLLKIIAPPDVLQKRPSTPTLKIYTIDYLKNKTKSFDYTLSVLDNLEAQTRQEIRRLGGNEGLERIMDRLHVDAEKLG